MFPWTCRGLFVLAALLLSGCSLFDSGDEAPSPAATQTAQPPTEPPAPELPTPEPTADQPGTAYPVEWKAPFSLPVHEGAEVRPPLADVIEGEAIFRLYVVEGDGEPRLLHESDRWLRTPSWSGDGRTMTLPYFTRSEGIGYGFGFLSLESESGRVKWDFRQPDSFRLQFHPSPNGTRFLVEDQEGATPPFLRGSYHLGAPDQEGLSLEGFVAEDFWGWSPDGRYFVSSGFAGPVLNPQEQSRDYFLLEPGRVEAVLFGRSRQGMSLNLAWSPDSHLVAFTEGTNLVVFDASAREREVIDLGMDLTSTPAWSADSRYIAIGDGVVDAESGAVRLSPTQDAFSSAVSPDASRLVRTTDPLQSCPEIQENRTLLHDVSSGQQATLFACGDGIDWRLLWLSADRLLVWSPPCYACEFDGFHLKLMTFPGQQVQYLTEGESRGHAAVSPDNERILVSSGSLRLYSRDGELLRQIEVPPDTRVTGISWAPDGSIFTYIVGPSVINLPP